MGTKHIGIIGAGIAGLHLGLRLQRLGIDCTIITDRTAEQAATAQLANIVVHWPTTLGRERVLGTYHWSAEEFGFNVFDYCIQTQEPVEIRFHAARLARAVDYRIYLPQLMEDFVVRGGRLEVCPLDAKDIGCIAQRFDVVVVAMPGNGFRDLFARDDANSPYDRPQRYILAGLYEGVRPTHARSAMISVKPGHGEAVAFPVLSRTGLVTAVSIVSYKTEDLTALRRLSGRTDKADYCAAVLRMLEELHPAVYDRIDTSRFDVQGPADLAQAAVTPMVRQGYIDLGDGKYAIALGDAHFTVDPMMAQGANIGSYSAFVLADAIAESCTFDLAFCHQVERTRSARILGASCWTNAFLQPPDEARTELMVAMSRNRQLADEYYDNFNRPEKQWQRLGSIESIRNWLAEQEFRATNPEPAIAGA